MSMREAAVGKAMPGRPRLDPSRILRALWRARNLRAQLLVLFALIEPPPETRVVPVVVGGARIGTVEIVSEPKDEIAEKWETTSALAAVGLAVMLAVIGALSVVFGRVLEPLTRLSGGLAELERR